VRDERRTLAIAIDRDALASVAQQRTVLERNLPDVDGAF
jgi:hypothetical protein